MKIFGSAGLCLCAALCLNVGPAAADNNALMEFNLPYAASLGNSTLPAGSYTVTEISDNGGGCVLNISSAHGVSVSALFQRVDTPDGKASGTTHISLRRQSGKYEIEEVWIGGQEYGFESFKSLGKQ